MSKTVFPIPSPVLIPTNTEASFPVRRVYCVGQNYANHAKEMGADPTRQEPFFFSKFNDTESICVISDALPISLPFPSMTDNLQHEVEIAVAIGKAGKNITVSQAPEHVFGYACAIDLTRRDLQHTLKSKGRPWEISKAFDYALPISAIYTRESLPHIEEATLTLYKNQAIMQQGNACEMIWNIAEIIAKLSEFVHLYPGDLILTGTPSGVSRIEAGDTLTAEVQGIPPIHLQFNLK